VLGAFPSTEGLLQAARYLRERGHRDLDTYSPYPLRGVDEALGLRPSRVPAFGLFGGIFGVCLAYGVQWWLNAVDYPIIVGDRPPHAPPSFIPITFELGVLLAALSIFFGLLFLMRLPQPYHPVFESESFATASTHELWLSVAEPDRAAADRAMEAMRQLGAEQLSLVEERPR
jgi:hypothetical protein